MRIGNWAGIVISLLAVGATTAPSTSPSVDPMETYLNAIALIRQGKLPEAQALLQQADRSYKGVKIDSNRADIIYASGICSMLQSDDPRAHQAFERVRSLRVKDRDFVLNDAKVDLCVKNLNSAAVKPLDAYLASLNTPDEEALDLFGAAIEKASQSGMTQLGLAAPTEHYQQYNGKLEARRPGMHHWGQRWMNGVEFGDVQMQKDQAQHGVDLATQRLTWAQDALNRAQANYNQDTSDINAATQRRQDYNNRYRTSRTVDPNPFAPVRANAYQSDLETAQANVKQRQQDVRDAEAKFPKPSFTANLEPILPEYWDAQAPPAAKEAAADAPSTALSDLLQKMVDEVGPAPDAAWSRLHSELAQKWLQTSAVGGPLLVTATYQAGSLRPDGSIDIACNVQSFTIGKLTVNAIKIAANLPESEALKAAKLVAGKPMKASGTVETIVLATLKSDPGNVQIELRLKDAALVP
jgi:hypothetical protein